MSNSTQKLVFISKSIQTFLYRDVHVLVRVRPVSVVRPRPYVHFVRTMFFVSMATIGVRAYDSMSCVSSYPCQIGLNSHAC